MSIVFHFLVTNFSCFNVYIFKLFFQKCSTSDRSWSFLVHEKLDHDFWKSQNKSCTYKLLWLSLHDLNPVLLCKPSCSVANRKYNWHFFLLSLAMLFVLHSRNHSDYPTFWQVLGNFFWWDLSKRCLLKPMNNSLIIIADWCLSTGNTDISACNI